MWCQSIKSFSGVAWPDLGGWGCYKSGTNAFRLDLPPYMHIYSVVNVEKLKLFYPPMIMDQDEMPLRPHITLQLFDKW
jgi:hypothetical protein